MSPPEFGPDYSVPQRMVHRETLPEESDNNARPYVIFVSYMLTCISAAVFIVSKLFQRANALQGSTTKLPPKKHVWLFSILAVGSLLTTWTHMFRYFKASYDSWVMSRSYYELEPQQKHWGLWLKETSLFREAWETVIVGTTRYWWSHQIFFFALGLGLYLEQKGMQAGVRRGIRYTWVFMLLGQIVAISFATNLFLLALLFSSPAQGSPKMGPRSHSWVGPWLLNLFAIFATAYPAMQLADQHYWHHPTHFMPMLLAPHVALMLLPTARVIVPARYLDSDPQFTDKVYYMMWVSTTLIAGMVSGYTTIKAYDYGGLKSIGNALFEHPAVSSVGFDVIFCWITWICWLQTQSEPGHHKVLKHMSDTRSKDSDDGLDASRHASGYKSEIRRR